MNAPHHAAPMSFNAWRRLLEIIHITIAPQSLSCRRRTRPTQCDKTHRAQRHTFTESTLQWRLKLSWENVTQQI